jgi:hypothetical protein
MLLCSVLPEAEGGWEYSEATHMRKIGSNPDNITFHPSIFLKVLLDWPAWAEKECKAGRLSLPQRRLVH